MSWDCYLSLGANLGNRGETLRRALRMLNLLPDTKLVASSSFYTTLPWGKTDQPLFLNAAAHVRTEMEPIYFLLACQDIEKKLGRERHEHWGARTCDIDLVYAPEVRSDTEALQLPHPFLTKRAFVLIPLQEIAPKLRIRQYAGKQSEEKRTQSRSQFRNGSMLCRKMNGTASCRRRRRSAIHILFLLSPAWEQIGESA